MLRTEMELPMKIINEQEVPVGQELAEVDEPEVDTKADLIVIAKYVLKTASKVPVIGWLLSLFLAGVILASITVLPFVIFMVAYHWIHKGK